MELDLDVLRTSLHLLAVTIWVGGQLTLGGLVPTVRRLGDDAPRAVARQFNRIAWPAFGVIVVTGLWNIGEISVGDQETGYHIGLFAKLLLVALSGIGAFLHGRATTKAGLAIWGAVGLIAALAALVLGVALSKS